MTYGKHGANISHVEVTKVSFEDFPWFKDVPAEKVANVELVTAEHLYWPELDVDLELESILHPERYPLVSGVAHEAGERYASPDPLVEDTGKG